ncbi:MAG: hypothetical protein ACYS0J_03010, partial [Planctomycetota bacterium]
GVARPGSRLLLLLGLTSGHAGHRECHQQCGEPRPAVGTPAAAMGSARRLNLEHGGAVSILGPGQTVPGAMAHGADASYWPRRRIVLAGMLSGNGLSAPPLPRRRFVYDAGSHDRMVME